MTTLLDMLSHIKKNWNDGLRPIEHKFSAPLGYASAAVVYVKEGTKGQPESRPRLNIMTANITDEHTSTPAESIEIIGLEDIMVLRDLLTKAIEVAHLNVSEEPVVQAADEVRRRLIETEGHAP